MTTVSEFLNPLVTRLLVQFRDRRKVESTHASERDSADAANGIVPFLCPSASSSGFTAGIIRPSTRSYKLRSIAAQALIAPLALLLATGCGGGWSIGGLPPVITGQPASQTVNVGQTATFTVTATGTGPLTYQWFDNGTAINGATSSSYTTPAAASTDNGSVFTVTVTNSVGTVTSSPATLTVAASSTTVPPPALSVTAPANQTVQAGQTATFSVTASGTAPFTYQWYKGGVAIPGATTSTYTTPVTTTADNGSVFTVSAADASGSSVTSGPATLTVTSLPASTPPSITNQPVSQTVTAGQTATFTVTAAGAGTLTYQWYKNGAAIPGAASSTYTTPVTASGDNGSVFTVVVTNAAGTVTSTPATLTVITAPAIVTSPANQTVNAGQTAVFSVTATGTAPIAYQWFKNGTAIPGAISSTYSTPATVASDSGSLFTVTATNAGGTATSSPATLTVLTAPQITSQPANQTVNAGQTATFSVTATGSAPMGYQWFKGGTAIGGANSSTYTTPVTVAADTGSVFTVTITNAAGTATSTPATLTVDTPPVITVPPASQTVNVGQTASFSVTATGSGPLSYQWSKGGVAIGGANSSTYTTPATVATDSGSLFTVTVTNAGGTATSVPATLTVNSPPVITTPPASQTVTAGLTATFSVTATGTAPLGYQWFKGGSAIGGANASTYTTPATALTDSGSVFTVTVTNAAGSATGGPAILTVTTAPVINSPPADETVTAGQTATFSVVATGSGTLTYQWYKGGAPIAGATASSYTTPATVIGDSGSLFTVKVTNATGSATGGPATLTVNTAPTITTPPASQTVNTGQTATFTVVAAGTGPLTYQWSKNGSPIAGATATSYTTPATVSGDSGSLFTVKVSNSAGAVTSAPATLTVNTAPTITTPPASQTVNAGQTATFSVAATGTGPLTYQWSKNGSPIPGATGSVYTTPATVSTDSGALFTVKVSNSAGSVTSAPATLTVDSAPTITTPPANQTVNAGQTATFSVTAAGTAPLRYQWSKNGSPIVGANSSSYTTPATVSGDSGSLFTVSVTNAAGSVSAGPATLTVINAPVITTPPASQTVTVGQTATFNVVATGSAPLTYQWYKNGAVIPGAVSTSYTTPATLIGDNRSQFTVIVTNPAGTATSSPATLTVNNTTPIASLLTCNPSAPTYNTTSTLIPTFSGGTATIGSSGIGSLDITASAVSGSSYTTPALTSQKTYTLSVTGSGGAIVSTTCTVVPTSVTISSISPANATIAPGKQAFNAAASGGLTNTVTWTASGGTFAGNVWTSPNTAGTYTITATSVDEPSVSAKTNITVSLPVITTQPSNQNVCTNSSTTLSVTALYASSYQWNLNGTPISGATSSSYFIASAISIDVGNYTVTVTNPAGSVTSNVAKVVVGSTIISNPSSLSIRQNQTATFSVAAAGEAPFTYQWYAIAPGASAGVAIAGATASSYTTPVESTASNGSQFYAIVTDACSNPVNSTNATLVVNGGSSPPTIITQPVGQTVPAGSTATFSVVAAGTPTLTYQWFRIPAGSVTGAAVAGATSSTYTVPSTETTTSNDQDQYYVTVSNNYGQATSRNATLAIGNGILITKQPENVYVTAGSPATFSVTAVSALTLTYQWYEAAPGSSTFAPIPGATSSSYTQASTATTDSGSVFYVVVSNGSTPNATSSSAALFVGPLTGVSNLCNGWQWLGDALPPTPQCSVQLSAATYYQQGEIVLPELISTGNIQLSFTVTTSNPSNPPADGFALVLGDPSLGATPTSVGATGQGLGAEGIPGFVLAFDDFHNTGEPPVPYLAVERGETALWENPYLNLNGNIPALAAPGATISHNYVVSIVQGMMNVTMDGTQVFSGSVSVPPVAYLYFTASTGADYEQAVISNLSGSVSAPSN